MAMSSAGLEWRLASGVALMVKADGDYGNHSQTYSGTGRNTPGKRRTRLYQPTEPPFGKTGRRLFVGRAQQPLQMLFSRAFINASSALIESTYLVPSTFEGGIAREGLAAADAAAGGVALS
jgi:hypothetical protein